MLSRVFGWLGISFLLVAALMAGVQQIMQSSQANFLERASVINATVINKEVKQGKGINYYIHYQYDWQNQSYQDYNRVEAGRFDQEQDGNSIAVAVDAEDPAKSQITGAGVIVQKTLVFFILTIVFGFAGAGFFITAGVLKVLKK